MKKLINDPQHVVAESLAGLVLSQPGTALLTDRLIVVRHDRVVTEANRGTVPVALISGGGAGHEPAHAGYVAAGMLTAAVSGEVFASPSVDAVLDGIHAVTGDAGALLIVKSYTGDRLNFGLAAEIGPGRGPAGRDGGGRRRRRDHWIPTPTPAAVGWPALCSCTRSPEPPPNPVGGCRRWPNSHGPWRRVWARWGSD